jgi:hypothetical protein
MFFRRERTKKLTFADHLQKARAVGFTVRPLSGSRTEISRNGTAVVMEEGPEGQPKIVERAGILVGGEIAALVDGGYQKFLQTPSGKGRPALAGDLKSIHEFQEDLREALGMVSLYNESLGTVSTRYIYDRVEDRDTVEKKPWEIPTPAKQKA